MFKINGLRIILLALIIVLLVSITYLVLDISTYLGGNWRLVQGESLVKVDESSEPYDVRVAEKEAYPEKYWQVISRGKLFFQPLPPLKPLLEEPQLPKISQPEKQVPNEEAACPWMVSGVIVGRKNKAILTNTDNKSSRTVEIGSRLGEFLVSEITVDYVLLKTSHTVFKLELGGK